MRQNSVVQARGRLNREINAEEYKTVAKWARAHGLKEAAMWDIY